MENECLLSMESMTRDLNLIHMNVNKYSVIKLKGFEVHLPNLVLNKQLWDGLGSETQNLSYRD